jgi:hypothetical protein
VGTVDSVVEGRKGEAPCKRESHLGPSLEPPQQGTGMRSTMRSMGNAHCWPSYKVSSKVGWPSQLVIVCLRTKQFALEECGQGFSPTLCKWCPRDQLFRHAEHRPDYSLVRAFPLPPDWLALCQVGRLPLRLDAAVNRLI